MLADLKIKNNPGFFNPKKRKREESGELEKTPGYPTKRSKMK